MDKIYVKEMELYIKETEHSIIDSNMKIEYMLNQINNDKQYIKCLKERNKIEVKRCLNAKRDLDKYMKENGG